MTLELSREQGRYLALGLLLGLLALVFIGIAWPTYLLHARYDKFIDDYTDRTTRYRRVAELRPSIEAALRDVEQRGGRQLLLKATTPTLAAAELQGLVTKIVADHQGKLITSQAIAAKDEGKPGQGRKVALSVQLSASAVPLQMILYTIETGEPYLFVDQLSVRANQGRGFRMVPGVQPEFHVQMTVHAYMAADGAKS